RDHQGSTGARRVQGHEPELRAVGALGRRGRGAVVGGLGGLRGSAHGRTLRSGPRRAPEPGYSYPASALAWGHVLMPRPGSSGDVVDDLLGLTRLGVDGEP